MNIKSLFAVALFASVCMVRSIMADNSPQETYPFTPPGFIIKDEDIWNGKFEFNEWQKAEAPEVTAAKAAAYRPPGALAAIVGSGLTRSQYAGIISTLISYPAVKAEHPDDKAWLTKLAAQQLLLILPGLTDDQIVKLTKLPIQAIAPPGLK